MQAFSTHCVFRRGSHQLAVPAASVREVLPCPKMFSLPRTPPVFTGLCHLRSEFIPVLNLDAVLTDGHSSQDEILLVIEDSDCAWAVLVDHIQSLLPLEISDAPESSDSDSASVVVGWAVHEESVIQILDPGRVRELAERELAGTLATTHTLSSAHPASEPVLD